MLWGHHVLDVWVLLPLSHSHKTAISSYTSDAYLRMGYKYLLVSVFILEADALVRWV